MMMTTQQLDLDNMNVVIKIQTPFMPLSHYDVQKMDTLLLSFPGEQYSFEEIGLSEIGDISQIDPTQYNVIELCKNQLKDSIEQSVRWRCEKEKNNDRKIIVKAYLVASTPRKYKVALKYLCEATSRDPFTPEELPINNLIPLDVQILFERLYERECPTKLIPLIIKLIKSFNTNQLWPIRLVTLSSMTLAFTIGASEGKVNLALQWLIKHQFVRQMQTSKNLYLKAAFFSTFLQPLKNKNVRHQCNWKTYHHRCLYIKKQKRLRFLAEIYPVKLHDMNEQKMKTIRNFAYKLHLQQLHKLKSMDPDELLEVAKIASKKQEMRMMTFTLFDEIR